MRPQVTIGGVDFSHAFKSISYETVNEVAKNTTPERYSWEMSYTLTQGQSDRFWYWLAVARYGRYWVKRWRRNRGRAICKGNSR